MATVIDRLIATLSLDGVAFQRGLTNAQNQAKQFGKAIGSELKGSIAGAFSVVAVTAFARTIINAVGNIQDLADRLQLSTDNVQKLQLAAKLTGSNFEAMSQGVALLYDKILSGNKDAIKSLADLGIGVDQIEGNSFNNVFELIAKNLSNVTNNAKQAEIAFNLFGTRGGLKFVETMRQMKEIRSVPFSQNQVSSIDRTADNLGIAGSSLGGFLNNLIVEPAMDLGALPMAYFRSLATGEKVKDIWSAYKGYKAPEVDILSDSTKRQMGSIGGIHVQGQDGPSEEQLQKAREWMEIQDEIIKLEEETTKNFETSRVAQLTTEERRNELLEERLKLKEKLAQMDASGVDFARTMNRVSEIETALVGLKPEDAVKARGFGGSVSSDSLTAIGGFTGGSSGAASVSDKLATVADILRRVENLMDGQGIKIRKF